MFQIKERLNNIESFEEETKKYRTTYDDKKQVDCFENLSNELFYEIFDYLEGCDLFKAFSNLNNRFQALLTSSSLRLKIDLRYREETILHLGHDHPYNSYPALFKIDSSFSRLESLYNKLSFLALESCIPISIANNEQYSSIKYLIIDHCCSLDDLIAILSYTSQLCRLTCYQLDESKKNIVKDALNSILSLTCISIAECSTKFDEIEMFLTNVSSQLEVLRINTFKDVNYLDANRWERIISQHLHHLNIFEFKYEELAREGLEVTVYHERLNEFNSLFWIKRKWFFRIYIDTRFHDDNMMIYSIYPYRETHSNFHKDKKNDESLSNDISQNLIQHGIILNDNVEPIQGNSYKDNEGAESFINEIGQNMSVPCQVTTVLCTESNVK
ncbi:unnamed protein product [Rotaria sordida]|uniref:F-box domain-containing protein n=1 Tax=Rotaria sordida TaxID=392033 RepID=A0A818VIE0_9BILA|nr:unnamed protein product [Rotaria sordida]